VYRAKGTVSEKKIIHELLRAVSCWVIVKEITIYTPGAFSFSKCLETKGDLFSVFRAFWKVSNALSTEGFVEVFVSW
jgi:hypothetical protein